jgi:hypothetical protein
MSNQPQRRNEEKFVIRLPNGMRGRIADQARDNNRSMNSEVLHRLERTEELESSLERAHRVIDQLLAGSACANEPGAEK